VVEAENERKLREADKQFWAADAGSAARDAGATPGVHRPGAKKKRTSPAGGSAPPPPK
jgi:hypothetical protein